MEMKILTEAVDSLMKNQSAALTAGGADFASSAGDAGETADGFAFNESLAETGRTALTTDRPRLLQVTGKIRDTCFTLRVLNSSHCCAQIIHLANQCHAAVLGTKIQFHPSVTSRESAAHVMFFSVHNELPPVWLRCIIASDCDKYYLPCFVSLPVHQIVSGRRVSVGIKIDPFPRRKGEIYTLETLRNLDRVCWKISIMHSHLFCVASSPFTSSGLKSPSEAHDSFVAPLSVPHSNMLCSARATAYAALYTLLEILSSDASVKELWTSCSLSAPEYRGLPRTSLWKLHPKASSQNSLIALFWGSRPGCTCRRKSRSPPICAFLMVNPREPERISVYSPVAR